VGLPAKSVWVKGSGATRSRNSLSGRASRPLTPCIHLWALAGGAPALPKAVERAHPTYQPRDTEHSVLHAVIREHLETFLREVLDHGTGLPPFTPG
jgi:hypothetical protein